MHAGTPSRTALRVAMRRAAHQTVDAEPLVLRDPLSIRILGKDFAAELQRTPSAERKPHSASLRAWMVSRSRLAEDTLAATTRAQPNTPAQYLVLGAGLDTFAYRNPHRAVTVFEVDHPATQQWKRDLLRVADISVPASAHLVAVDFERDNLRENLAASGFDFTAPTVTAWLGVVPYLSLEAFRATVGLLGSFAKASTVVFDYSRPRHTLGPVEQLMLDSLAQRVALAGEPFQLFMTPQEVRAELAAAGLEVIEDLGAAELNARFFASRTDGLAIFGASGRMLRAQVR